MSFFSPLGQSGLHLSEHAGNIIKIDKQCSLDYEMSITVSYN